MGQQTIRRLRGMQRRNDDSDDEGLCLPMLTVLRILSVAIVAIALFAVTRARKARRQACPMRCRASRRTRQADSDRCRVAEMRDKDKAATFSGNVKVVQGDTTMLCKTLVVFYDNDQSGKKAAMKSATPGPAAVRRSSGLRHRAASPSRRRIRR
jgi:hypothetical protein